MRTVEAMEAVEAAKAVETDVWDSVCGSRDLPVERGVAALLGDVQVAIFRTYDGALFAVGNQDPFTGAFVLSRGIVGSRGETPTVASPLHKQVFDLRTGRCLDSDGVVIPTYPVRERDGYVEVHVGTEAGRASR
ncbi:nitrite reductase small subunit NirD [Parafrankia sp. BMG5.11]|uniref:nitrite reductase small subunit NirD n=2 Tax=unclassified Parafrankia TaxID=2994368 RepID=UPI000DA5AE74|nr:MULTISPECIES: nitrite reductase small subunit NirD [unclassified Parafrankia]TCJ31719.1 nitrite reductase small subunit NirD [Parafrankia sp. BMG5.11]SQD97903.1 Nitrite reductase (NAD(P)H), small subunit [Parafrankia sp. Ea1.12]